MQCILFMITALPVLLRFLAKPSVQAQLGDAALRTMHELNDVHFVAVVHLIAHILEPVEVFRKTSRMTW